MMGGQGSDQEDAAIRRELQRNDDAILIRQVQKYNILYDANVSDYRNPQKRQLAFQAIATAIGSSASICENRWRVLRTRFVREHKAKISGTEVQGANKNKKWGLYNLMEFIEPHVTYRKKATTLVLNGDEASSSTVPVPGSPSSNSSLDTVPLEIWADGNTSHHDHARDISSPIADDIQNQLHTSRCTNNATARKKETKKSQNGLTKEILDLMRIMDSVITDTMPYKPQDYDEMWLLSLKADFKCLSKDNKLLFKLKTHTLLREMLRENN